VLGRAALLAIVAGATAASEAAMGKNGGRQLIRRTLAVTDDNVNTVHEVHVAGQVPTQLVFPAPLKESGVLLADTGGFFAPSQISEALLILLPNRDLPKGKVVPLTVNLSDGTILLFKLITAPTEVDLTVDVTVRLVKRAAPDSVDALRAALNQCRAQLDEFQADTANAGATKVASFILRQDPDKPQAFLVERHGTRKLDKQNRLLVEAKQVYRLFDMTYVVLLVENRDPSQSWVMERAEVSAVGGGQAVEVDQVNFQTEAVSLPPGEIERVVVMFKTPALAAGHRYNVALFEKNGSRHFKFEEVGL
jgi:uncharacterized protein (TIGR02268 family)